MSDHLDTNIKKLLERAPEPESWEDGAEDRIFAKVRTRMKEEDAAPPMQFKKFLLAAAALAVLVGIAFMATRPNKTTNPIVKNPPKPGPVTVKTVMLAATDKPLIHTLADGSKLELAAGSKLEVTPVEGEARPKLQLLNGAVTCTVTKGKGRFRVNTVLGHVTALGTIFNVDITRKDTMGVTVMEGEVLLADAAGKSQLVVAGEHREIGAVACVAVKEDWRSGQLIPKLADGTPGKPLEIRHHDVNVEIDNQIAHVQVEQTFFNPENRQVEGTFTFPLPPGATITRLAMYVGDMLMEGEIAEAQRARRTFEALKVRRVDPALLEWAGGNLFKMRVFPIEAKSEKRVIINYYQVLKKNGSTVRFTYPLVSDSLNTHPVKKIDVNVEVKSTPAITGSRTPGYDATTAGAGANLTAKWQGTNIQPKSDFVLEYDLAEPYPEVIFMPFWHAPKDEGYFAVLLSPRPPEAEPSKLPEDGRRLVFMVDKSGGLGLKHLKLAVSAVKTALRTLGPSDSFGVVAYDTKGRPFKPQLISASTQNIEDAEAWLNGLSAFGAGDLGAAWQAAAGLLGDLGGQIVYAGSGMSHLTSSNLAKRLAKVNNAIDNAPVRIHTLAVGSVTDKAFLQKVSTQYSGTTHTIQSLQDVDTIVPDLLDDCNLPVFKNVFLQFDGGDVEMIYPSELPNIAPYRQILVFGKYKTPGSGKITFAAEYDGKPFEKSFDCEFTGKKTEYFIPRLWGTRHIEALQDQMGFAAAGNDLLSQVVEASKRFRVMSKYTSFIVLESPEEYARYGIERRPAEFGEENSALRSQIANAIARKMEKNSLRGGQGGELLEEMAKKSGNAVFDSEAAPEMDAKADAGAPPTKSPVATNSPSKLNFFSSAPKPMASGAPMMNEMAKMADVSDTAAEMKTVAHYGGVAKSAQRAQNAAFKMQKAADPVWQRSDLFPVFDKHPLPKPHSKDKQKNDAEAVKILRGLRQRFSSLRTVVAVYDIDAKKKETLVGRKWHMSLDLKAGKYRSFRAGDDFETVNDGSWIAQLFKHQKYAAKRKAQPTDMGWLCSQVPGFLLPWADSLERTHAITIHKKDATETVLKLRRRGSNKEVYALIHISASDNTVTQVESFDRRYVGRRGRGSRYESYLKTTLVADGFATIDGVKFPKAYKVVNYHRHGTVTNKTVNRWIKFEKTSINKPFTKDAFKIEIPKTWAVRDLDMDATPAQPKPPIGIPVRGFSR